MIEIFLKMFKRDKRRFSSICLYKKNCCRIYCKTCKTVRNTLV